MGCSTHWDAVYVARPTDQLGWYEPVPSTLDLVRRYSDPTQSVVDIGGGDSRLVDQLVGAGYESITVVDLSHTALARARSRLGTEAGAVLWIKGDALGWSPDSCVSLWHDRAVFHFMVEEEDRQAYKAAAVAAVRPGGTLIVATFAPDGPESCAGLPVRRYDKDSLAGFFGPEFEMVEHAEFSGDKSSPGDHRPYTAIVLQRGQD